MYNLPNILTLSRIAVIPVVFLSVYFQSAAVSVFVGVLYVAACITDYFDGYLARLDKQVTAFGRLMDPIADKLLIIAVLVIILVKRMVLPVSYIPVIVIMCREILVSGLREFLAEVRVGMPVTRLAKWKTGFQMTSLGFIMFGQYLPFQVIGELLLWAAGALTAITGYQYFLKSLEYVRSEASAGVEVTVKAVEAKPAAQARGRGRPKKTKQG